MFHDAASFYSSDTKYFPPSFTLFYISLPGFNQLYLALPSFKEFLQVLLSLPSFT